MLVFATNGYPAPAGLLCSHDRVQAGGQQPHALDMRLCAGEVSFLQSDTMNEAGVLHSLSPRHDSSVTVHLQLQLHSSLQQAQSVASITFSRYVSWAQTA